MTEWISNDDWETIVSNVPIVSVDLLVRYEDGILLGKRTNEPAKGYWFMPGGRVQKGETRTEAAHRIGKEELGLDIEIVESLGAFEHFYDTSDIDGVSKHYLANAYVADVISGEPKSDEQHADLRVFQSPPDPYHEYLRAYVEAANSLGNWN